MPKTSKKIRKKIVGKNHIKVFGAGTNNLQNIDIQIPLGKFVLFSGPSGSGKSSLAIDTIFLEGKRRIIEAIRGINNENQLEVDVEIRNYYLNNLLEREVVKILS